MCIRDRLWWALAAGVPPVSVSWLRECAERGARAPFAPHVLRPPPMAGDGSAREAALQQLSPPEIDAATGRLAAWPLLQSYRVGGARAQRLSGGARVRRTWADAPLAEALARAATGEPMDGAPEGSEPSLVLSLRDAAPPTTAAAQPVARAPPMRAHGCLGIGTARDGGAPSRALLLVEQEEDVQVAAARLEQTERERRWESGPSGSGARVRTDVRSLPWLKRCLAAQRVLPSGGGEAGGAWRV